MNKWNVTLTKLRFHVSATISFAVWFGRPTSLFHAFSHTTLESLFRHNCLSMPWFFSFFQICWSHVSSTDHKNLLVWQIKYISQWILYIITYFKVRRSLCIYLSFRKLWKKTCTFLSFSMSNSWYLSHYSLYKTIVSALKLIWNKNTLFSGKNYLISKLQHWFYSCIV